MKIYAHPDILFIHACRVTNTMKFTGSKSKYLKQHPVLLCLG